MKNSVFKSAEFYIESLNFRVIINKKAPDFSEAFELLSDLTYLSPLRFSNGSMAGS